MRLALFDKEQKVAERASFAAATLPMMPHHQSRVSGQSGSQHHGGVVEPGQTLPTSNVHPKASSTTAP